MKKADKFVLNTDQVTSQSRVILYDVFFILVLFVSMIFKQNNEDSFVARTSQPTTKNILDCNCFRRFLQYIFHIESIIFK